VAEWHGRPGLLLEIRLWVLESLAIPLDFLIPLHFLQSFVGFLEFFANRLQICGLVLFFACGDHGEEWHEDGGSDGFEFYVFLLGENFSRPVRISGWLPKSRATA
jgi:hypothetical protein